MINDVIISIIWVLSDLERTNLDSWLVDIHTQKIDYLQKYKSHVTLIRDSMFRNLDHQSGDDKNIEEEHLEEEVADSGVMSVIIDG